MLMLSSASADRFLNESNKEDVEYIAALSEPEVSLEILNELPAYEELSELEEKMKEEKKFTFNYIFNHTTGYFFFNLFLKSEYAVEKAIFVKDVQYYKSMRFESARRQVATLLYERFVAAEKTNELGDGDENAIIFPSDMKYESTFAILQKWKVEGKHQDIVINNSNDDDDMKFDGRRREVTLTKLPNSDLHIGNSNAIGVYGESIEEIKEKIENTTAPVDLFDEVCEQVLEDLSMDVFPRFLKSVFKKFWVRTVYMESVAVTLDSFKIFRPLGRGGFGAVSACRKKNSGRMYAIKVMNKKLVRSKDALSNIMAERNILTKINSPFVTNIKYAFHDEINLYIVMDLVLGGDLKFHLINERRISEERVRFYAAEILLGLEHMHSLNIIYRDLKLENVLLDDRGHVRLSDLGLAVVGKSARGYAGTPGYTAPEMICNKQYGPEVDLFSFGVLLYRLLCGSKPFNGRDMDKAVLSKTARFDSKYFSENARSLIQGLLQKSPSKRLGNGEKGLDEIKNHPYFRNIDWGLLEAGYVNPPHLLNMAEIQAPSAEEIGDFDFDRFKNVHLNEIFKRTVQSFPFISSKAVQEEMTDVLKKLYQNVAVEKFANQPLLAPIQERSVSKRNVTDGNESPSGCCIII